MLLLLSPARRVCDDHGDDREHAPVNLIVCKSWRCKAWRLEGSEVWNTKDPPPPNPIYVGYVTCQACLRKEQRR